MIPLMLLSSISLAQVTMDPGTTAVRFVYSREIDRKNHGWIEEQVFDEWFDGEVPKICHICDNVYRYPVDNGSLVTRGLRSERVPDGFGETCGRRVSVRVLPL